MRCRCPIVALYFKYKLMKTRQTVKLFLQAFILFSILNLLTWSVIPFMSLQAIRNLVTIRLPDTTALSSIRGVYGGMGLTLFISLLYLQFTNLRHSLAILCLLSGVVALSPIIITFSEGTLGAFSSQWLLTESLVIGNAAPLLFFRRTSV